MPSPISRAANAAATPGQWPRPGWKKALAARGASSTGISI